MSDGIETANQTFTVRRDGGPDLRFEGELIAEAQTSPDSAHPDYSGGAGRWHRVSLYRTAGGKHVVSRAYYTQWTGESNSYEAETLDGVGDVIVWMMEEPLGREVLRQAGIEWVETVE